MFSSDRAIKPTRALPALTALGVKHGCGRRCRYDCYPCMRKDDALARTSEAAEARDAR
jgi:hypothetical protein